MHMFSVLMGDTEVGGHFVGMWLIAVFTTRKITLQGINHRISLAPTTVTQTNKNPADLLLRDISVSLCTLFKQMCITVCTYLNLDDISIVLRHSCTATRCLLRSSLVCLLKLSAAGSLQMLHLFLAVHYSQYRCWLFTVLLWPCST